MGYDTLVVIASLSFGVAFIACLARLNRRFREDRERQIEHALRPWGNKHDGWRWDDDDD